MILLGSSVGFAIKGDYIHTGLKRAYDVRNPKDRDTLVNDLKNVNVEFLKGFYREVDGGKYVNVVELEKAQEAKLMELLAREGINPKDADKFFKDPKNKDKVLKMQNEINNVSVGIKGFTEIEPDLSKDFYYSGSSTYAPRLSSPENYSLPIPGEDIGTTMISKLKLPSNATKWVYKVDANPDLLILDSVVKDTKVYSENKNVSVKVGEYFILCATDLSNKVKAYISIKLTPDMIKMPREEAKFLDNGHMTTNPGTEFANAIRVNGLPDGDWKYFVSFDKLNKLYADDVFLDSKLVDIAKDIVVVDDSTSISDDSILYLYFIKSDNNKITDYTFKEIKRKDLSPLPPKLMVDKNYSIPTHGDGDNTTKFTSLNLQGTGGTKWQYKVGADINVPIANGSFGGNDYISPNDIVANVGHKLILTSVDANGKAKSYVSFVLTTDHVKGKLPPMFEMVASKGSTTGTTKVNNLILPEGAIKFMYAIGSDLLPPGLDRKYARAMDYGLGDEIKAKVGETIYIFATDINNLVKAYGAVDLDGSHIKAALAMTLLPDTHYRDLAKGKGVGQATIKLSSSPGLEKLFDSQPVVQWRYKLVKEVPSVPEINSFMKETAMLKDGIIIAASEDVLKEEDSFTRNLILLATEGGEDNFRIKGFASFPLTREYIKYPYADKIPSNNYSNPEKGATAGTTKVANLKSDGIDNHKEWYYRVFKPTEVLNSPLAVEYKELLNTSVYSRYVIGSSIKADPDDYLVLVSVDNGRKALAYADILLTSEDITAKDAKLMKAPNDFDEPVPGTVAFSTKFTKFQSMVNTKWMYKTGKSFFGSVEMDYLANKENGFVEYSVGTNITNVKPDDWLLLVRTDDDYKANGYVNMQLTHFNVRNEDAQKMDDDNYIIDKGKNPSTTKVYDLNFGGIDYPNFNGWKWMYKVFKTKLEGENLPYVNQKILDANDYISGQDIAVNLGDYILLLATDNSGFIKAYVQIEMTSDMIRESAPSLDISLKSSDYIDRVRIVGSESSYMYKLDTKVIPAPALLDTLYGATKYTVEGNIGISAKIGNHLMVYKVDDGNRILEYKSFILKDTDIKKGKIILDSTTILEGNMKTGGQVISFTLQDNDEWNDVRFNEVIRNRLFDGLKADKQVLEWQKLISALKASGSHNIFIDGKTVDIRLPAIGNYSISEDQIISLTVPFEAVKDAITPIVVEGSIVIKPTIDATVSGTVVSDVIREKDIMAGGATIVLSLTDGSWNMTVDGILDKSIVKDVVDQDSTNWAKIVKAVKTNGTIVVNNEKTLTITLPKVEDVSYGSAKEVINLTIDKSLVQGASVDIAASPNFTIYPNVLKIEAALDEDHDTVILQAPDNKTTLAGNDFWRVKLLNSSFKEKISDKDISILGMPPGIKAEIIRVNNYDLDIKMTGVATSSLVNGLVRLVVKGSAVNELNSIDSNVLDLHYIKGTPLNLDLIDHEIKPDGIYLTIPESQYKLIEYSINSTNGINGDWNSPSQKDHRVSELIGPMLIYIREKAQPKVIRRFDSINHPPAPVVTVVGYEYLLKDGNYLSNVTIKSDTPVSDLEYSKNNGLEWNSLTSYVVQNLDDSSILVVRKKGTMGLSGILPSFPTARLNGLFLGSAKLNVANGKIDGSTTSMQYSLNSDENGNGGSWNPIKSSSHEISFANGNLVWIREGNIDMNKRYLDKVSQSQSLPMGPKYIDYNILNKTLTNLSEFNLQYKIANEKWYDLDKDTDGGGFVLKNVTFSPGLIEIRRRGDFNQLPSTSITVVDIPLPIDPPEIRFDNDMKTIKYMDVSTLKDLDDNFEYKVGGNGDWKNGTDFSSDEARFETITVFVRKRPTTYTLASKEITYDFTKGISLVNVSVNVAGGVMDGTTSNMEYSVDSPDGKDGKWTVASDGKTSIKFIPGMNLYIREKGKPTTFKELFKDLKRELPPLLDDVDYDLRYDTIYNPTNQNLEYRVAEGLWTRIDTNKNKTDAKIKAGNLEFRKPATANTLESISKSKAIIMSEGSQPVVLYNDTTNRIISINSTPSDWSSFEYRVDSNLANAWASGLYLGSEDLSGDKNVEIRTKATKSTLASKIAVVKFTKNIDLNLVILSKYTSPYELNGTTTDMEYKIIYLNGTEIGWNKCLMDNTPLVGVTEATSIAQIIIRDGRVGHRDNEKILLTNADSAPTGVKVLSYDYSTGKLIVKLAGVNNTMEYTKDSISWVKIDNNEVDVELTETSDLRVRINPGSNGQPSISTPRLNGLYLNKVTIDDSKLVGTNESMEYSLDGGSTWKLSDDNETPIKMAIGNKVMIRQLGSLINIRTIGNVVAASKPNPVDISYSIKDCRIVASTNLQYRVAEGPWISIIESPVIDLVFTPGKLEFRTRSSGLNLASDPITKAVIPNYGNTPEIRPINTGKKSIEYSDGTSWKVLDSSFEYRIGINGSWKPYNDFETDPSKDAKVMVYVRKLATDSTLPTIEKYVNFDANLILANVKVNVAKGLIENTTTSMEYSINSPNGLDGSWNPISGNNVNVSFIEGMNVWIREKGKNHNYLKLLDNLGRLTNPTGAELEFHIGMETISNNSSNGLEFRIKKGDWQKLAANTTINLKFSEGSLELRKAATIDKLESYAIEKTVIKAATSAPVVVYEDVNNKITSIDGSEDSSTWTNYQYRIKGTSNWIQGELLGTDIDLSGDKVVEIRRKADKNTLASQIAEAKFTKNLELSHVKLSTNVNPLELNGTTVQMEYNIYLIDGTSTGWTSCTDGNTKMPVPLGSFEKIEIRDSKQHENIFQVHP